MGRVVPNPLCPQEDESDGQVYCGHKTPLVRLDGTCSLLSEVFGDMMHPRRSGGIRDHFLNEAQVVLGNGFRAASVVGIREGLSQTLAVYKSVVRELHEKRLTQDSKSFARSSFLSLTKCSSSLSSLPSVPRSPRDQQTNMSAGLFFVITLLNNVAAVNSSTVPVAALP